MKQVVLCVSLLLSMVLGAAAQTKGKTGMKTQQVSQSKSVINKTSSKKNLSNKNSRTDAPTVLNSTGTYKAYGNSNTEAGQLRIADPVIKTLNERAAAPAEADVLGSGIIGMPKLTYGIANGHILFRTTDAPTLGTGTGSGSVGTGTNVGSVGAAGNALGVNGKNPYAGPGIYGLPVTNENFSKPTIEGEQPRGVRRKGKH